MFLQLPKEIQCNIYDRLCADDRVRLNMALPRNEKIRRTLKMTNDRNRKLGLVSYMLKKKRPEKLSAFMTKFILENKDDPTFQEVYKEYGIDTKPRDVSFLIADIVSGDFKNRDKWPTANEILSSEHWGHFLETFARYGNAETFDGMVDLLKETIFIDEMMSQKLFFDIANYGNDDLLRYIVEKKDEIPGIAEGCAYISGDLCLTIFRDNLDVIDMIYEIVGIAEEQLKNLMTLYLDELKFESADYLFTSKNVRL